MAIKTDAMIAHNGAEGYTIYVEYDPETDGFDLKALFNDGTLKETNGNVSSGEAFKQLLDRTIRTIENENVTVVGSNACANCLELTSVILPNVTTILTNAFNGCRSLRYVYIGSGATEASAIKSSSFANCENVVFDCGFASDAPAAANAPWGAANATVNYDIPAPNPPTLTTPSMSPNPDLIQNIDLEPLEEIQPLDPEPVEVKKTMKRRSK